MLLVELVVGHTGVRPISPLYHLSSTTTSLHSRVLIPPHVRLTKWDFLPITRILITCPCRVLYSRFPDVFIWLSHPLSSHFTHGFLKLSSAFLKYLFYILITCHVFSGSSPNYQIIHPLHMTPLKTGLRNFLSRVQAVWEIRQNSAANFCCVATS